MNFWQGENPAALRPYACIQRYQPLFRSRGKLCPLQAGLSAGSFTCFAGRVRLGSGSRCRRHRLGHGNMDSHADRERKLCFRSRTQRRDAAGGRLLAEFPKFTSVAGTAEATTLTDASIDFVTAAQAAHWFDRVRTRQEFVRILKPGGWLVLLWNERAIDSTPFLRDYEQLLLTYGTDYADVRHERTTDEVNQFFDPAPFQERVFPMRQEFDYTGIEG